MSTTVTYKGNTLTTVNNETRTLTTSGKYLEDDITLVDVTSGSSGEGYVWQDQDGYVHLSDESDIDLQTKTVSPSETAQTVTADVGYYALDRVNVNAISSNYVGSSITRRSDSDLQAWDDVVVVPAGYYSNQEEKSVGYTGLATPTATKGVVSNHSVSVTPSITQGHGYTDGGTKAGTAVTVSASELVSGTLNITDNDTYDVSNYASAVVNVVSTPTYTATVSGTGSSICYVKHDGVTYHAQGTFTYSAGDEIYVYACGQRGGGQIKVDGVTVIGPSQSNPVSYNYETPSRDIDIILNYGVGTGTISIDQVYASLSITQNGTYDVEDYDIANVNVSGLIPIFSALFDVYGQVVQSVTCNMTFNECYALVSNSQYTNGVGALEINRTYTPDVYVSPLNGWYDLISGQRIIIYYNNGDPGNSILYESDGTISVVDGNDY